MTTCKYMGVANLHRCKAKVKYYRRSHEIKIKLWGFFQMGAKESKQSENAEGQGGPRHRREKEFTQGEQRKDTFQFQVGNESKFWFMLEIIQPSDYPAEKLKSFIVKQSGISISRISGIKYLDRDLKRAAHVFVYGEDYQTVEFVWTCLRSIRGIHKVLCMPKPPQINKIAAFAVSCC